MRVGGHGGWSCGGLGTRERSRRWRAAVGSVLSWSSETWKSSWRLGMVIVMVEGEGEGGGGGVVLSFCVVVVLGAVGRENLHCVKLVVEEEEEVEDSH